MTLLFSPSGDSGGPLMALDNSERLKSYYYLAGIVSFGPTPCGLNGWPGVYTVRFDCFISFFHFTFVVCFWFSVLVNLLIFDYFCYFSNSISELISTSIG